MKPRRIYIAGPYNADSAVEVLANIRAGIRAAARLLTRGYVPFCPFLDFSLFLTDEAGGITDGQIKTYSLEWLRVCDAVLLLPGWERSTGTAREMDEARNLGLPIYYSEEELYGDGSAKKRRGKAAL